MGHQELQDPESKIILFYEGRFFFIKEILTYLTERIIMLLLGNLFLGHSMCFLLQSFLVLKDWFKTMQSEVPSCSELTMVVGCFAYCLLFKE